VHQGFEGLPEAQWRYAAAGLPQIRTNAATTEATAMMYPTH